MCGKIDWERSSCVCVCVCVGEKQRGVCVCMHSVHMRKLELE